MRSSLLLSRLPSASTAAAAVPRLHAAGALRSVGTQPGSSSSAASSTTPPATPAQARTDASGKTTHFGFKTVREEEKEDLGELPRVWQA